MSATKKTNHQWDQEYQSWGGEAMLERMAKEAFSYIWAKKSARWKSGKVNFRKRKQKRLTQVIIEKMVYAAFKKKSEVALEKGVIRAQKSGDWTEI